MSSFFMLSLFLTNKTADHNYMIRVLHLRFELLYAVAKLKHIVNRFNFNCLLLYLCYKLAQTGYAKKRSNVNNLF
jgi:hypothetical protein